MDQTQRRVFGDQRAINTYIVGPISVLFDIVNGVLGLAESRRGGGAGHGANGRCGSLFNSNWKDVAKSLHETSAGMYADASKLWDAMGSSFQAIGAESTKKATEAAAKAAAFRVRVVLSAMDAKKETGKHEKRFAGALS